MRVTVMDVEEAGQASTGATWYRVLLEGDDREFSTFDKFEPGEEAEVQVKQNGEFWNLKRQKKAYNKPAGRQGFGHKAQPQGPAQKQGEVIEVAQLAKSAQELKAMLACNAWNNASKTASTPEIMKTMFYLGFDTMCKAVELENKETEI